MNKERETEIKKLITETLTTSASGYPYKLKIHGIDELVNKIDELYNNLSSCFEFEITDIAFTSKNGHGIIKAKLPYRYSEIRDWGKGDKVLISHLPIDNEH